MLTCSRGSFAVAALSLAVSLSVLGACQNTPSAETAQIDAPVMPGQEVAERLCSGCHAIGRRDTGAHPDALPFRRISMHYRVRDLEEALAEGIRVGHPDMPPFQLEPAEVDDLLDYIEAIQDPV